MHRIYIFIQKIFLSVSYAVDSVLGAAHLELMTALPALMEKAQCDLGASRMGTKLLWERKKESVRLPGKCIK